jgi:hypothetical protein
MIKGGPVPVDGHTNLNTKRYLFKIQGRKIRLSHPAIAGRGQNSLWAPVGEPAGRREEKRTG